ncbi:bifunctional glutamate N-acetyltransferase/amino-acid acetyltransferase ArgJ [Chitinispirillales bacterium ANBcel5]|uniref:bifunctional glutamate N-acetyltransferase/amino-acid acetyltransferase ArgJ n=1 Tax=Cellulosispirillum alkaliphilum TaxID=3039283 RepID=UPI002A4E5AE0|nr:bifunctional glutamate N-acetyltransferase/amino-acid acetyltransferase ArgJ [Chitinispirillales bacterium ANBcel5]
MSKQLNSGKYSEIIQGGVCAARGFKAAAVKAGIKVSGKSDLGVIYSEYPCAAAGTFTQNAIRASSVDWCHTLLPSDAIHAVVCNSGCANACTGGKGAKDNESLATLTASALGIDHHSVLVASTGVIGELLPMEKISSAIPKVVSTLSPDAGLQFAKAIMTTDLVKKEAAAKVSTQRGSFHIGGTTKGSGMIHPNMATMLAFICTDAKIDSSLLNDTIKKVVDQTFNNLTVDGDTSTNDMVLVLANGVSGTTITQSNIAAFEEGLFLVCNDLCKQIAADGEGATKRVEINVTGAKSAQDAQKAAKAVANSNLTKCALFGNDPNWGRIACAVGYSGAEFSKVKMSIKLCGIEVFEDLQPAKFDYKKVHQLLKEKVVPIDIDLGIGECGAVAHTCDFSYDYVKINAEYHT